jgi:hypothetical protein
MSRRRAFHPPRMSLEQFCAEPVAPPTPPRLTRRSRLRPIEALAHFLPAVKNGMDF